MENVDAKTRELVGALSLDAAGAERALSDWFSLFPESLYRIAAEPGRKLPLFAQRLMVASPECCRCLCDPVLLTEQASRELALSLIALDPRLDIRLAQTTVELSSVPETNRRILRRGLAILEVLSCGSRINSALVQLLNCGNGSVRSKVVELLTRWSTNEANVREWLRDPDPRVRANVLESLAEIGQGAKWVRGVLLDNLQDRSGRAAANAAIGLYRLGVTGPALARLSEMGASEDASIRCSAVWAMGQIPDPALLDVLNQLRGDSEPRVRWLVLKSLSTFNRAGVRPRPSPAEPPVAAEAATVSAPTPPAPASVPASTPPSSPGWSTRTFGRLI